MQSCVPRTHGLLPRIHRYPFFAFSLRIHHPPSFMGNEFLFRKEHSLEERIAKATKMRHKYPDRIPVIVERASKTDMPEMEKKKYLVPEELTVGQFVYIIGRRLDLRPGQALFIFVGDMLPPITALMTSIYNDHKDEDGFLYVHYSGEKTFG